jgi:hypothetical protein
MAVIWEKSQQAFLTLWDIDREFERAHEAYEQWQARNRRKRSTWACLGVKPQDDALGKSLSLGRQVQRVMESGKELFGSRFEQGDSTRNNQPSIEGDVLIPNSDMSDDSLSTTSSSSVRNQTTTV